MPLCISTGLIIKNTFLDGEPDDRTTVSPIGSKSCSARFAKALPHFILKDFVQSSADADTSPNCSDIEHEGSDAWAEGDDTANLVSNADTQHAVHVDYAMSAHSPRNDTGTNIFGSPALALPAKQPVMQPVMQDAVLRLSDFLCGRNADSQARSQMNSKTSSSPNHQGIETLEWKRSIRSSYDFVISRTMKILESSEFITHVHLSENSHEAFLNIQLNDQGSLQKDQVLAFAQKALLDGAARSKSIFILGFRSASPFVPTVSGFDAKYVVMENANTACWHLFKRGFCGHGHTCRKQHPHLVKSMRVWLGASVSETHDRFDGERHAKEEN